jgi:hypothetical protein
VRESNTCDMIFDVPALIAFLSGSTSLLRGTVIFTGTPEGVEMAAKPPRWLKPGDVVCVEIEGTDCLCKPVVEQADSRSSSLKDSFAARLISWPERHTCAPQGPARSFEKAAQTNGYDGLGQELVDGMMKGFLR